MESENERYKQSCGAIGQNSLTIINQLKDRIAELEKENAIKTETITDLLNKQEFYEKEKLTKFAEMLKEKFARQEERFAIDVTRFETDLNKVKESDLPTAKFLIGKATGQATMAEKAQYYIDETLKECLCDNNQ